MNENIKLAAERAIDFVEFGGVASNPLTAEAHIKGLAKLIKTLVAESDKEAVRNAALEEAAKACSNESVDVTDRLTDTAYNNAIIHATQAIRALKSTSVSEAIKSAMRAQEGS